MSYTVVHLPVSRKALDEIKGPVHLSYVRQIAFIDKGLAEYINKYLNPDPLEAINAET